MPKAVCEQVHCRAIQLRFEPVLFAPAITFRSTSTAAPVETIEARPDPGSAFAKAQQHLVRAAHLQAGLVCSEFEKLMRGFGEKVPGPASSKSRHINNLSAELASWRQRLAAGERCEVPFLPSKAQHEALRGALEFLLKSERRASKLPAAVRNGLREMSALCSELRDLCEQHKLLTRYGAGPLVRWVAEKLLLANYTRSSPGGSRSRIGLYRFPFVIDSAGHDDISASRSPRALMAAAFLGLSKDSAFAQILSRHAWPALGCVVDRHCVWDEHACAEQRGREIQKWLDGAARRFIETAESDQPKEAALWRKLESFLKSSEAIAVVFTGSAGYARYAARRWNARHVNGARAAPLIPSAAEALPAAQMQFTPERAAGARIVFVPHVWPTALSRSLAGLVVHYNTPGDEAEARARSGREHSGPPECSLLLAGTPEW